MLESGISAGIMVSSARAASAQLAGEDSATLVRGEDRHHHFVSEPQPSRDLDPEFAALHRTTTECRARIFERGTGGSAPVQPRCASTFASLWLAMLGSQSNALDRMGRSRGSASVDRGLGGKVKAIEIAHEREAGAPDAHRDAALVLTEASRFALRRDFDLPGTPIRMMRRKGKNPCEAP